MKMIDILEKDKDRLLTDLSASQTHEKAVRILENETDKMLLMYNEQCGSEQERDSAAHMMQAVRLSLSLIDSNGKSKVWEHETGNDGSSRFSVWAVLALLLGIALAVFGLAPIVLDVLAGSDASANTEIMTRCGAVLAGIILAFAAGSMFGRPKGKKKREHQVELRIDPDKIYRSFRTVILSVDQSLDEVRAIERWNSKEKAGNIDGRPATTPELELFSDLLAAAYSKDPEYALEKIDAIRYYLHKQQIEVVDFSEETRQFFDLMPGTQAGTIRPALVADGALLKKGLASTGGR